MLTNLGIKCKRVKGYMQQHLQGHSRKKINILTTKLKITKLVKIFLLDTLPINYTLGRYLSFLTPLIACKIFNNQL